MDTLRLGTPSSARCEPRTVCVWSERARTCGLSRSPPLGVGSHPFVVACTRDEAASDRLDGRKSVHAVGVWTAGETAGMQCWRGGLLSRRAPPALLRVVGGCLAVRCVVSPCACQKKRKE